MHVRHVWPEKVAQGPSLASNSTVGHCSVLTAGKMEALEIVQIKQISVALGNQSLSHRFCNRFLGEHSEWLTVDLYMPRN